MTRFNSRIAAAVGVALGAVYLVASLASGHSARAEPPAVLAAAPGEFGLDVWKAAALLVEEPGSAVVVDLRGAEEYARWHVPGSVHAPDADAAELLERARQAAVIVIAARDEEAAKRVAEARASSKAARIHYLQDGPRAWYLAFELPVTLFAEAAAPRGYEEALDTLKAFLARPDAAASGPAREAVRSLATMNYQPGLLRQGKKPKPAGGARKKISGGCG